MEAGFALQYSNPAQGLTVEGRVRGLLAHSDGVYEEWGASGLLRLDPGVSGRGVSLTVAPVWGAASGGVEHLWSTDTAASLAAVDAVDAQARLQAELGYGLRPARRSGCADALCGFLGGGWRTPGAPTVWVCGGAPGPCSRWRLRAATVRRRATHNPPLPPLCGSRIAGSGDLRNAEQRAAGEFRTRLPFEPVAGVDVESHVAHSCHRLALRSVRGRKQAVLGAGA